MGSLQMNYQADGYRGDSRQEAALVRYRNVDKSFDGRTFAIRGLNLDVYSGEFLTLLGPSGSGKTTTLMMLSGFETVTRGDILLKGQQITTVPPYRRGIGFVFQNYALFPHMTVAENLAFPLQARRCSKADIDRRVTRALEMVELPGYAKRRPHQLSGGQQQRVALARALIFEPTLVLMDEPLGALDKQLREQMQYHIKSLHERLGVTILYVTHDQSEALSLSDRIAVFKDGCIQQIDTPALLYESPNSSFVARFVGENNSPSGEIISASAGVCNVRLDCGPEVEATAPSELRAGQRTTLSVRPERIAVGAAAASLSTKLKGRIEHLTYLGDHVRVRILVRQRLFIVKIPNDRRAPMTAGSEVVIGWRAQDCLALDPVEDSESS